MLVLAVDCTAKSVSAALADSGKLIGESFLNVNFTHSETLMPIIEELLKNTRKNINDIDAFAITAGPGSFTGVRIGISAVKGLAFGNGSKVFSYSAFDAMAYAFSEIPNFSGIICGLMDARCNQFYNAVFEIKNGKIKRICNDRIIMANDLENEVERLYNKDNVVFAGDGAKLFVSLQNKSFGSLAPENLLIQRASSIALKASTEDIKNALSPDEIMPIYLRKSQAEREKEKRDKI